MIVLYGFRTFKKEVIHKRRQPEVRSVRSTKISIYGDFQGKTGVTEGYVGGGVKMENLSDAIYGRPLWKEQ